MARASAVSERVLRARNALTVTQRACFLIEHGNRLKAEKQHGVIVDGGNGETGGTEKKNRWRALHQWWHLRIDGICWVASPTMTKKENHSSCQPALKGLCENTLEAPFSQECLFDKIMRVNRKQMCMFSALLQFLTSTTCEGMLIWCRCWNTNRKRKWKSELALLSANPNL